jgi:hypothetical protein
MDSNIATIYQQDSINVNIQEIFWLEIIDVVMLLIIFPDGHLEVVFVL